MGYIGTKKDIDFQIYFGRVWVSHIDLSIDSALLYYELFVEKDMLLKYFLLEAIESSDYLMAEQLLLAETSSVADWAIYGLRVNRQDYTGALAWLQQMSITNFVDQEFKQVQSINLDFRHNPSEYILSETDYSYLQGVAMGLGPVRDYAHSLLGLITGQRFDPGFSFSEEALAPPMLEHPSTLVQMEGWNLFPNPVNKLVMLSWMPEHESNIWRIEIYDMIGRKVDFLITNATFGSHHLDLSQLYGGLYNITVFDEQRTVLFHSLLKVLD